MTASMTKNRGSAANDTGNASWFRTLKVTLMVVGPVLSLLAFESTAWIVKDTWTGCGDFLQRQWENLYDKAEGDPFTLSFWGVAIGVNVSFISACILLSIVDLTGKPAFLLRYKVQEEKNVPLDPERLTEAVKLAAFNQVVIGAPIGWLAYKLSIWRGCDFSRDLPSFHRFVFEFVFAVLTEEIFFYYSHRLLHHPAFYKHIHKKHHEWTAPISITAIYCHPLEHALSNLVPVLAGPIICGGHVACSTVWMVAALLTTTISHSGFHFPFLPSPEAHDYHHLKFNQCYGVLGLLDTFHNTNDQFKASVQYKRHYASFTPTPLRDLYPDEVNDKKK